MTDWYDLLRVVNLIGLFIVLVHLIRFTVKRGRHSLRSVKDQLSIWYLVTLSCIAFSVESLLVDSPFRFRSIIITIVVGFLLSGVFVERIWPLKENDEELL